jgi:hypothetical protein
MGKLKPTNNEIMNMESYCAWELIVIKGRVEENTTVSLKKFNRINQLGTYCWNMNC